MLSPENNQHPSKTMTRFLCQELLYDYYIEILDGPRSQAVADFLTTCPESTRELEKMKKGARYVKQAREVQVHQELIHALAVIEEPWKAKLREYTAWSSHRGWKMLPYVFLTAALTLGLILVKPWETAIKQDLLLAEQLKKEPDLIADNSPPVENPTASNAVTQTEPLLTEAAPLNTEETSASGQRTDQNAPADQGKIDKMVQGSQARSEEVVRVTESKSDSSAPAAFRGFLLRADLSVGDFQNTWPSIRDKVLALGGKAAGNVELGWLRKKDQSYFHFSLPESNYNELEVFLGTFGRVRFSKERHPRVMPEGQIRIILTVKDGITNESSSETP